MSKCRYRHEISRVPLLSSQLVTDDMQAILQSMGHNKVEITIPKVGHIASNDRVDLTNDDETEGPESKIGRLEEELKAMAKKNKELELENKKLKGELKQLLPGNNVVTEGKITEIKEYEDFSKVANWEWPGKIFQSAFWAKGQIATANKDTDLVVIAEDKKSKTPEAARRNKDMRIGIEERYPEVRELEGNFSTLETRTCFKDREGNITNRERLIYRVEVEDGGKDWFERLRDVKEDMSRRGRSKLAVYPPVSDASGAKTRRMLECIFRGSGIKAVIYTGGIKTVKGKDGANRWSQKGGEVLIVGQEGRTYAELLKEVKDKVKPGSKAAEGIRRIREARNGQMVIVIEKGKKEAVTALKDEMGTLKNATLKTRGGTRETRIQVQGIDPLESRDEIVTAVGEAAKIKPENVKILNLRNSFGGNQDAIIGLPSHCAMDILAKGEIRIGLNTCPVRERVDVIRCHRCWKYGHTSTACKEPDKGDCCRRCGGLEHKAKDCNGREYCLTCRVEGHTLGTSRCPQFREALKAERDRRSGRR